MEVLIIFIYIIIGSLCSAAVYVYNCREYKRLQGIPGSRVERYHLTWSEYSKENDVTEFCVFSFLIWILVIPICSGIFLVSYIQKEIKNYYGIKQWNIFGMIGNT